MHPAAFDEANTIFDTPPGLTSEQCEPINGLVVPDPTYGLFILTCWKPTKEELEEIQRTGRVWVYHYGMRLQPHYIGGHNPFSQEKKE